MPAAPGTKGAQNAVVFLPVARLVRPQLRAVPQRVCRQELRLRCEEKTRGGDERAGPCSSLADASARGVSAQKCGPFGEGGGRAAYRAHFPASNARCRAFALASLRWAAMPNPVPRGPAAKSQKRADAIAGAVLKEVFQPDLGRGQFTGARTPMLRPVTCADAMLTATLSVTARLLPQTSTKLRSSRASTASYPSRGSTATTRSRGSTHG